MTIAPLRRLVVTGLPCPESRWETFLGEHPSQKILSFYQVLSDTHSCDLRDLSERVATELTVHCPDSLICHGFGVPLSLIALLRLHRRGVRLRPRVTLFNGALRKVDVFKATHPLRAQFLSKTRAIAEIEALGGAIDPRLAQHIPRIRAIYRMIIGYSLGEKFRSMLGLEDLFAFNFTATPLQIPMQMIVSPNDPYIPFAAIDQVRRDFSVGRFIEVKYGHFPYSVAREKILPLIEAFEQSSVHLAPQYSAPQAREARREAPSSL